MSKVIKGNVAKRKQYYSGDIPDGSISMSKFAPDVVMEMNERENDIALLQANKADKSYNSGFIGGSEARLNGVGGAAIGYKAQASLGGAAGNTSKADEGGAVGYSANTNHGGAVGKDAHSMHGGAVGRNAVTRLGAAIGDGAQTVDDDGNPITAIQLGGGTNTEPNTAKFFDYTIMNADGTIPRGRIPEGGITTEKIARYAVTRTKVMPKAINERLLAEGAVTKKKLSTELAAEIDGKAGQTALTTEAEARAAADAELENSKADKIALDNYYTKTEADDLLEDKVDTSSLSSYYTKTETDTKIAEAKSIIPKRYIVDTLPTEDIDTNGTYLVPAESPNENNLYDEYAYINGAWEKIGSAVEVDLSSYYTKDEMDYTVNTLQDEILERIAKLQPINNPLAPSVRKTALQVLTDSVYTNSQLSSVSQKATEALEGLEDKADKPAITTPTGTSVMLSDNTEARFGEVASLTLTLPTDTTGDYISSVAFTSGATATSLTYPDTITMMGTDCIDGVFAPVASKRYTVIVAYDGAGLVGYVAGHEVTA